MLSTKAGDLQLGIPKLRKGSFFPEILEPRRRIDQALYAVVMEAYVHGISTRSPRPPPGAGVRLPGDLRAVERADNKPAGDIADGQGKSALRIWAGWR